MSPPALEAELSPPALEAELSPPALEAQLSPPALEAQVSAAALELHPQVALRPEPFGALAYHYGNRRLSFLRSPELVSLVTALGEHPGVDEALSASGIDPARWPSFRKALASLLASEVVRERGPAR